jgi:hypothetical protein
VLFCAGAAGTAVLAGLTTWSGLDALSAKRAHAYTQPEIDEINSHDSTRFRRRTRISERVSLSSWF